MGRSVATDRRCKTEATGRGSPLAADRGPRQEILALIEETPDITLAEMAEHLDEAHGLVVAQSTIWRLLDRRGMTFKKKRTRQRAAAP